MKRNLRNGLLALMCTLVLTACTDSSPKGVTETFDNALREGDIQTVAENATEATISLIGMSLTMSCGSVENTVCIKNLTKDEKVLGYEVVSETETQASVMVKTEKNGKEQRSRYDLIKTDDGWKVNLKK